MKKENSKPIEYEMGQNYTQDVVKAIAATIPIAKMYRAKYEALVSEGFTASQALEILKARGLNDF